MKYSLYLLNFNAIRSLNFLEISTRKSVPFLKNSLEIVYRPILHRVNGPISIDDLNPKPYGKGIVHPVFTQPNVYSRKSLADIHDWSQREDEKIRCTKQFPEIKSHETAEYYIDEVIHRKKLVTSLDARRNFMPIIAPGDKIYRNVDYSPDFFKEGGLAVGSTNSARYNKTCGKKANNFYDTLDLNIPTLDPKKLWSNKIHGEDQNFNKDYVANLGNWEENYLGLVKLSKEEKAKLKKTNTKAVKNLSPGGSPKRK